MNWLKRLFNNLKTQGRDFKVIVDEGAKTVDNQSDRDPDKDKP